MFPNLGKDIQRHISHRVTFKNFLYLLTTQGVWSVIIYRFGYWVHHYCRIPVVVFLLKIVAFIAFKMCEIVNGVSIPFSVKIGEGLYLGHFGGPIINEKAVIGKHCSLGIGTVVGTRGLGSKGAPVIGDNVYVGAGAKILGKIKIGNNVRIGANAVVVCDIPDGATAVGIPARVIHSLTSESVA